MAAWPLAARAQQPAMPVIGFLNHTSPDGYAQRLRGFHQGLKDTGHVEGENVAIEYRWAENQMDRLPALAADLVDRRVSIIVTAGSTPAALVAKAATVSIPIVFFVGTDPVKIGLVASLSRPGGNVTGVTNLNVDLGPKRLELLHEAVPGAARIALLLNPTISVVSESDARNVQLAARRLGLQLHVLNASNEQELESAFATLVQLQIGALVIGADTFFTNRSEQIAALAVRHAVPAMYQTREFAVAGGLMSYGGSQLEVYRLAGIYAGRILKGVKPADLPVQQITKVELIINLKTAKALGLTIPLPLSGRACNA
jgi:putative tryptophan/tyrosine transport system substrate-binding protein